MVKRKICVCKRLRFNPLRRVHNQQRTLARGKRARNLVIKIDMTGGVDKIQDIVLSVLSLVVKAHGARFYRYSALTLKLHIVEQLLLHFAAFNTARELQKAVGKSAFSVVDMRYDTKISYVFLHFWIPFVILRLLYSTRLKTSIIFSKSDISEKCR